MICKNAFTPNGIKDTHFKRVRETTKYIFWICTHGGWELRSDKKGKNLFDTYHGKELKGQLECEEVT